MRDLLKFAVVIVVIIVPLAGVIDGISWLNAAFIIDDDSAGVLMIGTVFVWCAWIVLVARFADTHLSFDRPKPSGYVGRFRRPDGCVVHVARLGDGTLMVASEEPPGQNARDLGTVTGRDLLKWTKQSPTPDG